MQFNLLMSCATSEWWFLFIFRLGFLIDFLSHAAIVGYMAGTAITIGLQQLKGLLGISNFTQKTDIVSVMRSVWSAVHHGVSFFFFLMGWSELVMTTIIVFLFFLSIFLKLCLRFFKRITWIIHKIINRMKWNGIKYMVFSLYCFEIL